MGFYEEKLQIFVLLLFPRVVPWLKVCPGGVLMAALSIAEVRKIL